MTLEGSGCGVGMPGLDDVLTFGRKTRHRWVSDPWQLCVFGVKSLSQRGGQAPSRCFSRNTRGSFSGA